MTNSATIRCYVTKSKAGHYHVTAKNQHKSTVFKVQMLSSKPAAQYVVAKIKAEGIETFEQAKAAESINHYPIARI